MRRIKEDLIRWRKMEMGKGREGLRSDQDHCAVRPGRGSWELFGRAFGNSSPLHLPVILKRLFSMVRHERVNDFSPQDSSKMEV